MKHLFLIIFLFFATKSIYSQSNCEVLIEESKFQEALTCLPSWSNSDQLEQSNRIASYLGLNLLDSTSTYVDLFFETHAIPDIEAAKEVYLNGLRAKINSGKFETAIDQYREYNSIVSTSNDSLYNYKINFNTAKAFFETGDYYTAEEFYRKANTYTEPNSKENYHASLQIANTIYANRYNEESLELINEISDNKAFENYFDKYFYVIKLGILTSNMQYAKCDSIIPMIESTVLNEGGGLEVPFIKIAIVSSYLSGNTDQMDKYLEKASKLPQEVKDYMNYEFYDLSRDVLKQLGPEKAAVLTKMIESKEYEMSWVTRGVIARSELKFQRDKEKVENQYLQIENEHEKATVKLQNRALLGFVLGVSLLLGLLYRLRTQHSRIVEINADLKEKNHKIKLYSIETLHRTKNQIALIANLITNQKQLIGTLSSQELIENIDCKVKALAEVNRSLESDESTSNINVKLLLQSILKNNVYSLSNNEVQIVVKGQEIIMDSAKVSQLALIINELSTNSIKYAVNQVDDPKIEIELLENQDLLEIQYRDNGKVLDNDNIKEGKGTELIRGIVSHLSGTLLDSFSPNGYSANIKIPNYAN